KPLKFKLPTPDAEALFATSFTDARARYAEVLAAAGRPSFDLANVNFDLGQRSVHGGYPLADETYAKLLNRLARRKLVGVPVALRNDSAAYYSRTVVAPSSSKASRRTARIENNSSSCRRRRGKMQICRWGGCSRASQRA